MSPRASEPRSTRCVTGPAGKARNAGFTGPAGFTLIELLIGMLISGVMVVVVTRFFKDSHRAYNIQELLADRDQNAQYVLKRLEERVMEAGANLPETGFPIIIPGNGPSRDFSLVINPRGGMQTFYGSMPATQNIPVDDPSAFKSASSVLIVRADKGMPVEKADIATGYNLNGFVKGLKKGSGGPDMLRLTGAMALESGDAIYAFSKEDYSLANTNLSMGQMVLAENIETVGLDFYDSTGTRTTDWDAMHSAKLSVTAKTQRPDPGYPGDGYRRVTITSEVRMRNRP
jgi:type IV pilus assembly protein PilW